MYEPGIPSLTANQIPLTKIERWFLAVATAPRLHSWIISQDSIEETVYKLTPEIKSNNLDEQVRQKYKLGLIVRLPDFDDILTEINLLEDLKEEPDFDEAGHLFRLQFKIEKTYNFYLPNFKNGEFQLHFLIEI